MQTLLFVRARMSYFIDDYFPDSNKKQKKSYVKNQKPEIKDYDKAVETLMNSTCDYKNIFGYIAKDKSENDVVVKYAKNIELFVCYHDNNGKLTKKFSCIKSWRDYNSDMFNPDYQYNYVDEIR